MSAENKEITEDTQDFKDISHGEMVTNLFKPGEKIFSQLTEEKCEAVHAAIGIAGEAGELLDAVKKYTMYNKDVDHTNLIEELGDLEFYMEAIRQVFSITRDETLEHNKKKLLGGRYTTGKYSDEQAVARADKVEEVA